MRNAIMAAMVLTLATLAQAGGHWRFERTYVDGADTKTADWSGNGNHGTLIGGPTLVDGRVGRGMQFVGTSNQRVDVGTGIQIADRSVFTFCMWIKAASTGTSWENFFRPVADNRGWMIQRSGTGANVVFRVDTSGGFNQGTVVSGFLTGSWVHLAMVVDVDVIRIYRDGSLASTWSPDFGDGIWNPDAVFRVGNDWTSGVFDADDVIITPFAWTEEEVRAYYHTGVVPARRSE